MSIRAVAYSPVAGCKTQASVPRPSQASRRSSNVIAKAQPPSSSSQHGGTEPALPLSRRAMLAMPVLGATLVQLSGPALARELNEVMNIPETVDWSAVKSDILSIIKDESVPGSGIGEKGPTLVRLAWHSSGTYDKMMRDGGSGGGTIRFKEELAHGGNAGLDKAVDWLEPVHAKHPGLSYADLYTYSGVVAVEAMGGPAVPFSYGRVDALSPDAVTPDGRLPAADKGNPMATAAGLRETFYRMGFNDQEIVALSGAHALGRCHADASGYVGPWQATPTIFSNIYFILLKKVKWEPNPDTPKFQYKDPAGTIMMLPSDLVLIQDEEFKKYVDEYAKDRNKFYADFSAAFQKLEELGTSGLTPLKA